MPQAKNICVVDAFRWTIRFMYKTMPRPGVVIPFTHDNQVVGHTTRFLDDRTPRYIQDIQPGYVFGTDLQRRQLADCHCGRRCV
jgi:hypothetical protein